MIKINFLLNFKPSFDPNLIYLSNSKRSLSCQGDAKTDVAWWESTAKDTGREFGIGLSVSGVAVEERATGTGETDDEDLMVGGGRVGLIAGETTLAGTVIG